MADRVIRALTARLSDALTSRSLTIAVAESCTGGELCAALTGIPGSSAYFAGGVVAYADAVKTGMLGVRADLIASRGAVSDAVALSMADGVRRRLAADVGVGITGIAGPGGGTPTKPVGTVLVGISVPGVRIPVRLSLRGDREAVRRETVVRVLKALIAALEDLCGAAGTRRARDLKSRHRAGKETLRRRFPPAATGRSEGP